MAQSKPTSTLPSRRRTVLLSDGSYLFEDELSSGSVNVVVVTCAAWLLEFFQLRSGDVSFSVGTGKVRPDTNCFGVFYPPFSLTRPCFKNPRGRVLGIADSSELPNGFSSSPLVFETAFKTPASAREALDVIRSGQNLQSIEATSSASLLSRKAKRLIDESYLTYPAIARIAKRLGVSHEHLSRQFKSDLRMSPSEYLRRLRVADAPLRLARGEDIINVSLDVGYNDLSRFYKQFRKTTNTSPGVCKTLLKPHT